MKNFIKSIKARQILDSRGNPTLEVTVVTDKDVIGVAAVPSGASVGKFEALELRDDNSVYFLGKSVLKAVQNVNQCINKFLNGMSVFEQFTVDKLMIDEDGSENKSNLGANAILGVSLAVARAAANTLQVPLFNYIGGINAHVLPVPMINILNGGVHADNGLDFQEFMIVPVGFSNFSEAVRCSYEVFNSLKKLLHNDGFMTSVGDEGGFAPDIERNEQALEYLIQAIDLAGYDTDSVKIAIDAASSEFYENGYYHMNSKSEIMNSRQMSDYLTYLSNEYPVISIEDGMAQDDYKGWKELTEKIGKKIMLVGDDLMVTNYKKIENCYNENIANSVLIKPNQTGTLTETFMAVETAKKHDYKTIISHRSGDTADTFIADLAVGLNAGFIKTGSLSRSERVEKYNRLMYMENLLGENAVYSF